jgi:hypothetical protein
VRLPGEVPENRLKRKKNADWLPFVIAMLSGPIAQPYSRLRNEAMVSMSETRP